MCINIGDVTALPLKEILSRDWENTGPGLILGQDQGRHRVIKQTERKPYFIAYDLFTTLSLEYKTTFIVETTSTSRTLKSSLQVVLNARFPQIDFWRTLTAQDTNCRLLLQNRCKSSLQWEGRNSG